MCNRYTKHTPNTDYFSPCDERSISSIMNTTNMNNLFILLELKYFCFGKNIHIHVVGSKYKQCKGQTKYNVI